jgi:hypothetical protein
MDFLENIQKEPHLNVLTTKNKGIGLKIGIETPYTVAVKSF